MSFNRHLIKIGSRAIGGLLLAVAVLCSMALVEGAISEEVLLVILGAILTSGLCGSLLLKLASWL